MKEKEKYMAKTTLLLENIYKREQFFFYCLARTWKKKQSIVWYSWLQPLSSLNRAIKRTQSQKKWFSVVFFFLVFLSFVKQIGNSNHNALPLSMQDESFSFMVFELKNIIRWKIFNYSKNRKFNTFCPYFMHIMITLKQLAYNTNRLFSS